MAENLVLRFRDFIESTIPEHQTHITKFGFVWWGWWNKPAEKISIEIHKLKKRVEDDGFVQIFLLDSGTLRLYKAKVIEIDFRDDEEPKECRDILKVPEYYFHKKCKIWFKFQRIIDEVPDAIKDWAYDDPSDFVNEFGSVGLMKGIRIQNIKDMTLHQRTMYFLTKYDSSVHCELPQPESCYWKDPISNKINRYVDKIFELIENINKTCDYSPKKKPPPIKTPRYFKEVEQGLKQEASNATSFSNFSSHIYKLIVEGHSPVIKEDRAAISKSDFLNLSQPLFDNIRVLRNDLHHSPNNSSPNKKKKVGDFYQDLCGVRVLDNSKQMINCQTEILKQVHDVLEKELELVKQKLY